MQIQAETLPKYAIQSYTPNSVCIDQEIYTKSLLVNAQGIQSPLPIYTIGMIHPETIIQMLEKHCNILIIGHHDKSAFLPATTHSIFMQNSIGVECMQWDAACRTFNILLSEDRAVSLLLIL